MNINWILCTILLFYSCNSSNGNYNDIVQKQKKETASSSHSNSTTPVTKNSVQQKEEPLAIKNAKETLQPPNENLTSSPVQENTEKTVQVDTEKKEVVKKEVVKPVEKKITLPPPPKKSKKIPKIQFDQPVLNFGIITSGNIVEHNFVFRNTGNKDLQIEKTDVSCGCTVPSFPFVSIEPGGSGQIGVKYNSVGKLGEQEAYVEVFSNADTKPYKLLLKGRVIEETKE